MIVRISHVNMSAGPPDPDTGVTKGVLYREYDESSKKTVPEIYRDCMVNFGRCASKVYIDRTGKPPLAHGWVFLRRLAYEDEPAETYLCETWVSLYEDRQPLVPVDIARRPRP